MFSKCRRKGLDLSQKMGNNKFLLQNTVAVHWTHQIASCHQSYHGRFTVKITNSPNMVCMVKHATEDLQHRNLDFSKYLLLHFHVKMERARQREERLRQQREQYTE